MLGGVEGLPPALVRIVHQTCEFTAHERTDARLALFALLQLLVGSGASAAAGNENASPASAAASASSRWRPASLRAAERTPERGGGGGGGGAPEKRISDPTTASSRKRRQQHVAFAADGESLV